MRRLILMAAMLTLAACSQQPSQSGDANNTPSPKANTAPTQTASAAPNAVPAAFLGVWDGAKGHCDPDSDMRVEIGKQHLAFYESSGEVKQVTRDGPGTIELTMAMDGEGEQWTQKMRFALSPDAHQMTASPVPADHPGMATALKRCPS
ncbi:hypothetical protein GRI58_03510 [Porphyrobacter algicida]|uniref:Lipoprotein n=1 Tax=Qipengyuania algicida TaxID=1836209 RepID=A0A845ACB2_9SPHN|nr:hypothetical protein [Qipengyuania algicida]MXP27890.1 hypothetical protein [Qipengyuania algicida]